MNPLFVAVAAVQDLCRERGWGFCFIGGLAVLRWGEPRLTRDIDLTNLAGFGAEEPAVDGLLVCRLGNGLTVLRGVHGRSGCWPLG
jgi:hypothetical protein